MHYQMAYIKALFFCLLLLAGGCADSTPKQSPAVRRPWKFETDRSDYKPRNVAKVVKPTNVSNSDLQKIKRVSVVVTSIDPLFGRIVEDQLSASLRNNGFDVVEPLRIYERTLGGLKREELIRLREQMDLGGKIQTGRDDLAQAQDDAGVIAAGKELGLDALIIGKVHEERRPVSFNKRSTPSTVKKLMILTFNIQIMDIRTKRNVLSVKLTYDEDETIINATDTMMEFIIHEIGTRRSL